jgi:putative transposase
MNAKRPSYHGYRFTPEIISHAVWLYYRFCLSFRDVEDLLAKRGVVNPALDPQTSRAQRGSVLTSISMEVDSTAKYPLLRLKAGNSKRDLLSGVHAR